MPAANTLRLDDGFSTIIVLANLPDVKLYEKEITPPGYSSGAAIDTTTMRNTAYRTAAPRRLKSLTNVSATVAYATEAYDSIWAQIGVLQRIKVIFPDASAVAIWGWIDSFTPSAIKEGEQPTAALVIVPSMRDADGAEVAPEYIAPADDSSGA